MNWIKFNVTVAEAEKMLKTQYYAYGHDQTGTPHVACDDYSLPETISRHIDIITPTVHFDRKIKPHSAAIANVDKIRAERDAKGDLPSQVGGLGWQKAQDNPRTRLPTSDPRVEIETAGTTGAIDLSSCASQITPTCLRALYGFSENGNGTSPGNSFGIVEYTPQVRTSVGLWSFIY
jgi:tripeptidyl-peptidase I